MKKILLFIIIVEIVKEILVVFLGISFLLISSSIEDLILDVISVKFISEIDEIMYKSFINDAIKTRLNKYKFEHIIGINEGDTTLKETTYLNKKYYKIQKYFLWIMLLFSGIIIFSFKYTIQYDLYSKSKQSCRWI